MKTRKTTTRIIIHHSLSKDVSVDVIRKWHKARKFSDVGYHYVIREDGTVEQGRALHTVGAHSKGNNSDSIGICVTGDFSKSAPNMWQYFSLANLCKSLCDVYTAELDIEYHHDTCPGKLFDREYFEGFTSKRGFYK